jgi:general secretion pathway protein G
MHNTSTPSRRGFTLVELLVVIAIIGILAGIITPILIGLMKTGPRVNTTHELGQFDNAIQAFMSTYNVKYIPSQFVLCERAGDYNSSPLDQDSKAYLLSLWPQLLNGPWGQGGFIDWNGDGQPSGRVVLEGHQCLVFFLGGIPLRNPVPNCFGFASDPRNPANLGQATGRKGPFFEFKSERLGLWPNTPGGNAGYYSYGDVYCLASPPRFVGAGNGDQPYALFSSYGMRNMYNKYGQNDNQSLGVTAYYISTTPPQYHNPTSQQIISAGLDQRFGPGGQWISQNAAAIAPNGRDDMSNFNGGSMMSVGN